jgi:two-component system NtrC family sensor kinase
MESNAMNPASNSGEEPGSFPGTQKHLMNYRRIWRTVVFLTGCVSLIPLIFITIIDYQVTQRAIESEFLLRTTRIISNTQRAISFFLAERKSALNFIIRDNDFTALEDPNRLLKILENLQDSFGGGFMDLGLIDSNGLQRNYIGPYELAGKNYKDQEWFTEVVERGDYISDVFLGYRKIPHFVIAVKRNLPDGSFYILRAALGIGPFEHLLSNLELEGLGDAFMINHEGTLQTASRNYGKVLDKISVPVPSFSEKSEVYESGKTESARLVIGYKFIDDSPYILMIVKNKHELMKTWMRTRLQLIAFLLGSITVILTVIVWTAGFMVRKIQIADQRRVMSLHQVEYANKMASIGRMAANVAHEINNPLAIINEKAGLVKDLFIFKGEYSKDDRLITLIDAILASVKRAGAITKRLLTFARKFEASVEKIDLKTLIGEVMSFFQREADHRNIELQIEVPENIPEIESDVGKLQQIFVNIINNAFAAITDKGRIRIQVKLQGIDQVLMIITDSGCGISKDDLHRIFEPFFSTKKGTGGTGLGLSITYNLVQEIKGKISVDSKLGKGTTFYLTLPIRKDEVF